MEYTFNGFGEYTVLNANNDEFILQGRMQPLNIGQGVKSSATVFTAFAMRQRGGTTIQVCAGQKTSAPGSGKGKG